MAFGGLKLPFGTFDSRFIDSYGVTAGESGLINAGNYGVEADTDETTTQYSGYVFEGDYTQSEVVKIQLLGKRHTNDAMKASGIVKFESQTIKVIDSDDYTNTALSFGGEVSYIVNDLATVALDAQYEKMNINSDLESKIADDSVFKIRPAVMLSAGANARITAAFQYDKYLEPKKSTDTKESEYSIPVIFRVKF